MICRFGRSLERKQPENSSYGHIGLDGIYCARIAFTFTAHMRYAKRAVYCSVYIRFTSSYIHNVIHIVGKYSVQSLYILQRVYIVLTLYTLYYTAYIVLHCIHCTTLYTLYTLYYMLYIAQW